MEFPLAVALAQAVPELPAGRGWWFEPKLDGHRTIVWCEAGRVRLQSRSGRDVTGAWTDLAQAARRLPAGTVLDGEAVVYVAGRVDFNAAQARAASSPARAAQLAARWPASFAAWDLLAHAELGDVRSRPYLERRALLLDVLEDVGPPLQVVPTTDDRDTALLWYEALRAQGVEGLVAKHGTSTYRAARIWRKIRHADTLDVDVVGFTGPRSRPRALAVRLPDGRTLLSQAVSAPVRREVAARIAEVGPGRPARSESGTVYEAVETGLVAEVLAGTTRHGVVTVTRLR
ncbi:DNA ligase [Streptomyces sp. RM72]|uniref:ATP-dependent DNA ligase n=1 Tax=Streptomyces sp. RM72 TaxID=1115510 RepID=UPI0027E35957|nr:DNA ligase [Streptomyces sp. RM72]